jgi:hypothetical protein
MLIFIFDKFDYKLWLRRYNSAKCYQVELIGSPEQNYVQLKQLIKRINQLF